MAKTQAESSVRTRGGDTMVRATLDPAEAMNGLEPIFQAGNKMFENWMVVGSELLEFGRARFDRSVEMSKAIARSQSIDEAFDLQADYTRAAMREYFAEAGKLADLSTRAFFDGLSAWQPAMRSEVVMRRTA